jgi:chemotaxis protein CheX
VSGGLGIAPDDLRSMVDEIWSSLFDPPPEDAADESPIDGDVVAGYVDIAGGWDGRVLVSTTQEGALAIAAAMLALPVSHVAADDLADAMGELANIVGGSVKSCVDGHSTLSLPAVSRVGAEPPRAPHSLQVTAVWRDYPLRVRVQAAPMVPAQQGPHMWESR